MFSQLRNWRRKRKAGRAHDPPATPSEEETPRPDPYHRIYAVGDVHGRADLLEILLGRLREDADRFDDQRQPILVFLGDLIDRGDHSREALDIAMAAVLTWPRAICLMGNHEAALLRFLDDPEDGRAWLGFGGLQTLASYGVPVGARRPDGTALHDVADLLRRALGPHATLMSLMDRIFVSGDVVLSHAGFDPALPLSAQTDGALLWGRSAFLETGPPPGLRAIHGHWDAPEAVVTPRRVCIDTGAYYTGRLTAVCLDDDTRLITADWADL